MSTKKSCKNCGSFDLEVDPSRGDMVCTKCGYVLEDSVIVSEVQFEENAHGGSSAIGQFVSSESKGGNMTLLGGSFNYGIQKESKEITIQKAKHELSRMCQSLRINQHGLETALGFYKMALNRHLTKGRRTSMVCAACLYIACRINGTPHLLIDFSDFLQVDAFSLGRTFTSITQVLYITLPLIDPCVYVLRYANQMNLGEKTHEVGTTAMRILQRMKRDFLHCGRRPSGLCGAALILAARFHEIPKKLKDIVKIVHIQEVTLRKRLMEFGETPSSSLTTDEFLTVDLGEEQDPPSYKIARSKDKERLQKYSDVEYELKMQKLTRLIDKELDKKRLTKKRTMSSCSRSTTSEADSVCPPKRPNVESPSNSTGTLKDIIESNLDDDSETNKAVAQSTVDIISDVCSTMNLVQPPSSPEGIGPSLETIGINTNSTRSENEKHVEEEQAKTNEPTINLEEFSTDDLDEEELDSYIVSEEECQQKQKAWSALYATYLEEQKRKEEERLSKEKEEGKSDKKKNKKPRKTKPGGAATAGEAVEKVLREKKISNKLNYDVLKSLNVDDFVKSMNFRPLTNKNESNEHLDELLKIPKESPRSFVSEVSKGPISDNEDQDDNDDMDEDEAEEEPAGNVLKLSNILRNDFNEDEEYEDYDF